MKSFLGHAAGFLILSFATACGSSHESQDAGGRGPAVAQWQNKPLTIDGSDADWDRPLQHYVREEKVSYSITNDSRNLYILLSTKDRQEQQKIIEGGMSVWVNMRGEKSNGDAVGIGYPLNQHSDRDQNLMEEAQPQRYQDNNPVTLDQKRTYALYAFGGDSTSHRFVYGDSNPAGVQMRLDYNNEGEMIYEAAIPLRALYAGEQALHPGGQAPNSSGDLAVGIFINGLPSNARIPRGGSGGGPGIGFGVGGGMGGWGSGMGMGIGLGHEFGTGGRRVNRNLFEDDQIWEVTQLARK